MKIQYASDLHLEFYQKTPFQPMLTPAAPTLVLAGDIGRPDKRSYKDFLQYCSRNWTDVVVVAGNHEFYNSRNYKQWRYMPPTDIHDVGTRLAACNTIAAGFPNVHFLDRRRVDIGGMAFLGATLWTDVTGHELAAMSMNDYSMITPGGTAMLSPTDVTGWHRRDRAWLDSELRACEETQTPAVVVTHHLPTYRLIHQRYRGSELNPCFATECKELLRDPVKAWFAGHTHAASSVKIPTLTGLIKACVNPCGYPGEQQTGYKRDAVVEVSLDPSHGDTRDQDLLMAAGGADMDVDDDDGANDKSTTRSDNESVVFV